MNYGIMPWFSLKMGFTSDMLYIHFPFCRSRCLYCGFYSTVAPAEAPVFSSYAQALVNEFRHRKSWLAEALAGRGIRTVYLGGGTPSLMPPLVLERLLADLRKEAADLWHPEELTLEVNPDDVDRIHIAAWRSIGINRVSIGVQALDDEELRACGRRHRARQAAEAVRMLTEGFPNVSVDIIVGLPRQSRETLRWTVRELTAMNPQHISAYMLEVEAGTPLYRLVESKRVPTITDEESEERFMEVCAMLTEAGYEHYEISNFCQPGWGSRHNSAYWAGHPYLGLGAGAASYDGKRHRLSVTPDLSGYLQAFAPMRYGKEIPAVYEEEHLTDEQLRDEYLLTRLRRREGFLLSDYGLRFGARELERLTGRISALEGQGYLVTGNGGVALTYPKGVLWSDGVVRDLAAAICREG